MAVTDDPSQEEFYSLEDFESQIYEPGASLAERTKGAGAGFVQGAGQLATGALGLAAIAEGKLSGKDPRETWAREAAEYLNDYWEKAKPPAARDLFTTQAAGALGQAVGMVGPGALARATKLGTKGATILMTTSVEGPAGYFEALNRGASEEKAWAQFALNAGIASVAESALGVGRVLDRINRRSGNRLVEMVTQGVSEGVEEFATEALQDLVRTGLYGDEWGEVAEWAHAGKLGALTGFVLGALHGGGRQVNPLGEVAPEGPLFESLGESGKGQAKPKEPEGAQAEPVPAQLPDDAAPEATPTPEVEADEILVAETPEARDAAAVEAYEPIREEVSRMMNRELEGGVRAPREGKEMEMYRYGKARGVDVVFTNDKGISTSNYVYGLDKPTILVADGKAADESATFTHEFTHHFFGEFGNDYQALKKRLDGIAGFDVAQEGFDKYATRQGRTPDEAAMMVGLSQVENEGFATFVESFHGWLDEVSRSPQKIQELMSKDRTFMQKVVDSLRRTLNSVLGTNFAQTLDRRSGELQELHDRMAQLNEDMRLEQFDIKKLSPRQAAAIATDIASTYAAVRDIESQGSALSVEPSLAAQAPSPMKLKKPELQAYYEQRLRARVPAEKAEQIAQNLVDNEFVRGEPRMHVLDQLENLTKRTQTRNTRAYERVKEKARGLQGQAPSDAPGPGDARVGDRVVGKKKATKTVKRPTSRPEVMKTYKGILEAAGKAIPIRVGRGPKGNTAGWFNPQKHVIRLKNADDLSTAAHEVAHATEALVYGWEGKDGPWKDPLVDSKIQDELATGGRKLYGDRRPAGGYKREGWAEFMRLYLTTDIASKEYPELTKWFEGAFLPKYPKIRAAMREARGATDRWRGQGSRARASAQMVDTASFTARMRKTFASPAAKARAGYRHMFEALKPINRMFNAARERGAEIDIGDDGYMVATMLRGTSSGRVKEMVESGMVDIAGNKVGGALRDVSKLVSGRYRDFSIYLWARRARALWESGTRDPGITLDDANQIIDELQSDAFEAAAARVYQWNDGLLEYLAGSSPTFRALVERIRSADPGSYVPLQRVFDDLDRGWSLSGSSKGGSPVRRLKGSGRQIKNPLQSMVEQAETFVKAAHHRVVMDKVVALSEIEGMGDLIEEVPPDRVPVASRTLDDLISDMRGALKEAGSDGKVSVTDEAGKEIEVDDLAALTVTFFSPARIPKMKPDEAIIPIWDGKKVRWYEVPADVYRALNSLEWNGQRMPKALDWIFGVPTRVFRAGTTSLRWSFGLVRNTLLDFPTWFLQTRTKAGPAQLMSTYMNSFLRIGASRVTGKEADQMYAIWKRMGGEMAQRLGQDMAGSGRLARRATKGRFRRFTDPGLLFDFYREFIQFPEAAPRVAEMKLVAKNEGIDLTKPLSMRDSLLLLQAGKQATTDFTAAGDWAANINRFLPFFNASLQGIRNTGRAAARNPRSFALRSLSLVGLTWLLWRENKDKEWYRQMDPRERWTYWSIETPSGNVIQIPRPFEAGAILTAGPEMAMDLMWGQADEDEKELITEWLKHVEENINPVSLPPTLRVPFELSANWDGYWQKHIVPQRLQGLPEDEQFHEYTTQTAIEIGRIFNVSPLKVEHAIRNVGGGFPIDLMRLIEGRKGPLEKELADDALFGRLYRRGGRQGSRPEAVTKLFELREEYRKKGKSIRNPETEKDREVRLMLHNAGKLVGDLMYVRSQEPDKEKRSRLWRLAVDLSKEATARAERGEISEAISARFRKLAREAAEMEEKYKEKQKERLRQR